MSKNFSNLLALNKGEGRHCFYISLTGSGISISLSVETSCIIKPIGNKGAKSSGPAGCFVPGCNGGGGGLGKSEFILYQVLGAFDSSRIYFILFVLL